MTTSDRPRAWNSTLPVRGEAMKRAPFKARPREVKVTGTLSPLRTRPQRAGRAESFPPDVAALIDARDPWCMHCGATENLQRHHRRIRGIGGDGRDHTHCACAGVRLCVLCHVPWAHLKRRESEAEGFVIPRSELEPWRRPLLIRTSPSSGLMAWHLCDGSRVYEMPEGALAA